MNYLNIFQVCEDRRESRDASYVEIVRESNGFSWCVCGEDGTRYHKDGESWDMHIN